MSIRLPREEIKNRKFMIISVDQVLDVDDRFRHWDFYGPLPYFAKVFTDLESVESKLLRLRLSSAVGIDYTLMEIKKGGRVRVKSKPRTKPKYYFRKLFEELVKI